MVALLDCPKPKGVFAVWVKCLIFGMSGKAAEFGRQTTFAMI